MTKYGELANTSLQNNKLLIVNMLIVNRYPYFFARIIIAGLLQHGVVLLQI